MFGVGSTAWLLRHELRLAWRRLGRRPGWRWRGPLLVGVFLVVTAAAGVPTGFAFRHFQPPLGGGAALLVDLALLAILTLMVSQTLSAAVEALYSRGDLDLVFSSPIDPRKVLAVRCAAIAVNAVALFAILATPFLLPIAVIGHPTWLAAYLVLATLAMMATAAGLGIAVGLFRVLGPRRTRAVGQVLAALIGAGFFLVSQARTLLGAPTLNRVVEEMVAGGGGRARAFPSFASVPLRALVGQPGPLAVVTAIGVLVFAVAVPWIGRRFAANAAAAAGGGVFRVARAGGVRPFAGGVFPVTLRKELRLLARDPALLGQVLLNLLFLLPMSFVVLRNAVGHAGWALPGGVAVVTFMAGQTAAGLVWITVSAEDAPELIACAPVPIAALRRAKFAAALGPLGVILILPLLALTVFAPIAGAAAIVGAAASASACGLIAMRLGKPGKRATFRRRASGSLIASLAEFGMGALIALAAALAAQPSWFALAPSALSAGCVFLLLRGSSSRR